MMKKFIPLILLVIFFCVSLAIKQDLLTHGNSMSEEERANNYFMQLLALSPITLISGFILLVKPLVLLHWVDSTFDTKLSRASTIKIFVLRLFGIGEMIATIRSLIIQCTILIK